MVVISVVKSRFIVGGIYLNPKGSPSAYGLFDCRTRSGGGENALISYGILQPLPPWDSKLSDTFPSFRFPCIHQLEPEGVDEGL